MAEIKILVTSHRVTPKNGRAFITYKAKMNLIVDGEEEKGRQVRWVDCKFVDEGDNLNHSKVIKRGYITTDSSKVDKPKKFIIKHGTDKKGNEKDFYPTLWIHEFTDYEECFEEATQDDFASNEDKVSVKTDEEETEESTL